MENRQWPLRMVCFVLILFLYLRFRTTLNVIFENYSPFCYAFSPGNSGASFGNAAQCHHFSARLSLSEFAFALFSYFNDGTSGGLFGLDFNVEEAGNFLFGCFAIAHKSRSKMGELQRGKNRDAQS